MPYPMALALTLFVELPVVMVALRPTGAADRRGIVASTVLGNLLTHPVVWLALAATSPPLYWPAFGAAEAGAVLVEAAVLARRRPAAQALAAAVLANALSCSAGLLVALAHPTT